VGAEVQTEDEAYEKHVYHATNTSGCVIMVILAHVVLHTTAQITASMSLILGFLEAEVVDDRVVSLATGRRELVIVDILVPDVLNILAKVNASTIRTVKMKNQIPNYRSPARVGVHGQPVQILQEVRRKYQFRTI
jgi:hypothetical protein